MKSLASCYDTTGYVEQETSIITVKGQFNLTVVATNCHLRDWRSFKPQTSQYLYATEREREREREKPCYG